MFAINITLQITLGKFPIVDSDLPRIHIRLRANCKVWSRSIAWIKNLFAVFGTDTEPDLAGGIGLGPSLIVTLLWVITCRWETVKAKMQV